MGLGTDQVLLLREMEWQSRRLLLRLIFVLVLDCWECTVLGPRAC
jgi:hypothetical protein